MSAQSAVKSREIIGVLYRQAVEMHLRNQVKFGIEERLHTLQGTELNCSVLVFCPLKWPACHLPNSSPEGVSLPASGSLIDVKSRRKICSFTTVDILVSYVLLLLEQGVLRHCRILSAAECQLCPNGRNMRTTVPVLK